MKLIRPKRHSDLALFDDFINSFLNDDIREDSRLMPIDIIEREDFFKILADMPGFEKKDIKLTFKNHELLIETCKGSIDIENDIVFHHKERFTGCYQRVIKLPDDCDYEKIGAKLINGVLEIKIPKINPKPQKHIDIE